MLIPKHCSNPKCHRSYTTQKGADLYREVLVKLSTELQVRVISICSECVKDYDMQMAQDVLNDVLPVEIQKLMESATMQNTEKLRRVGLLTNYSIQAIGRDIDEINKKLYV